MCRSAVAPGMAQQTVAAIALKAPMAPVDQAAAR